MDFVNICIMSHMSICCQELGSTAPVISIYVYLSWPEMIVDRTIPAHTQWGLSRVSIAVWVNNGVMSGLLS